MKKLGLLLICLMSVLCSYSEIPKFEIISPDEQKIINSNNYNSGFQERFNAAKELIWVLPSNKKGDFISQGDMYAWSFFNQWPRMDTIITHFKSLGIPVRVVTFPFSTVNDTWSMPNKVENEKEVLFSIINKKYYTQSSLIVTPKFSMGNSGYTWNITFHDIYQELCYHLKVNYKIAMYNYKKEEKSFRQSIANLPTNYTYTDNYEYIRPGYTTNWTEEIFKEYAKNDGLKQFEGIYQKENQRYFIKKHEHLYYLVACGKAHLYLEGDIKGILTPTATQNVFLGGWNEGSQDDPYVNSTYAFSDVGVEFQSGTVRRMLIKVWPTSDDELSKLSNTWTGTAWSLKNGYIVTNHHVVENAKSIKINVGDKKYDALVKAVDKTNDLAILYVEELKDCSVPYAVKQSLCAVGEKCFVLGYPMSNELGKEIKLTDGIISSRVGYQDNVSLYQISAPVQPGNSGCPMFDENGNVAGVINSGVPSADNVGYAIKLSYLRTLLENYDWVNLLPDGKEVESLGTLTEKVNSIKEYVYLVECSN